MNIPVNLPLVTREDEESVLMVLREGWISGEGPYVQSFEKAFADSVRSVHAVAVSNGSMALEIALEMLELPRGSRVALPTFSIISTLAPVLRLGLVPVFVDSSLTDWNADEALFLQAIDAGVDAVVVVHTFGLGMRLARISAACSGAGIPLIEDAAEAHGVTVEGKACGTVGDIGIFSFYANKLISTGEGGMIVTSNSKFSERARILRNLAFRPDKRFIHDDLGWNARMTNMQAALGESQLKRIDSHLAHKRQIAGRYRENLSDLAGLTWQPETNDVSENSYWVAALMLSDDFDMSAEEVRSTLADLGVQTRSFFFPLHRQPVLGKFGIEIRDDEFPTAELMYRTGLYLPSGTGISMEQVDRASAAMRSILS